MRCNEFLTRYGIADPGERERLRLGKIAPYPAVFVPGGANPPLARVFDFLQYVRLKPQF